MFAFCHVSDITAYITTLTFAMLFRLILSFNFAVLLLCLIRHKQRFCEFVVKFIKLKGLRRRLFKQSFLKPNIGILKNT